MRDAAVSKMCASVRVTCMRNAYNAEGLDCCMCMLVALCCLIYMLVTAYMCKMRIIIMYSNCVKHVTRFAAVLCILWCLA